MLSGGQLESQQNTVRSGLLVCLVREVLQRSMSLHSKLYDERRCKKVENPVEKYVSNGKRDISFELMVNYKNASLDEWTDSEDESSKKKKKGQLYIHHFNVINQIDEQFCIIKLPTKILRRSAISPHNY